MPHPLIFSRKAVRELAKTAEFYSKPQHQWRMENRLHYELTNNQVLMRELYRMGNKNPYLVNQLLLYSKNYIRQTVAQLQQQNAQMLPPSHPLVVSNVNHPLNPSNPRNLMLNPGMNLLFQMDMNTQAAILEAEEELREDQQAEDKKLAGEMFEENELQDAAQKELALEPTLDPYETLGLKPNASEKEIQTACYEQLAETALKPGQHSHTYSKIAAAAVMLGFGHDKFKDHERLAQLADTAFKHSSPAK